MWVASLTFISHISNYIRSICNIFLAAVTYLQITCVATPLRKTVWTQTEENSHLSLGYTTFKPQKSIKFQPQMSTAKTNDNGLIFGYGPIALWLQSIHGPAQAKPFPALLYLAECSAKDFLILLDDNGTKCPSIMLFLKSWKKLLKKNNCIFIHIYVHICMLVHLYFIHMQKYMHFYIYEPI